MCAIAPKWNDSKWLEITTICASTHTHMNSTHIPNLLKIEQTINVENQRAKKWNERKEEQMNSAANKKLFTQWYHDEAMAIIKWQCFRIDQQTYGMKEMCAGDAKTTTTSGFNVGDHHVGAPQNWYIVQLDHYNYIVL